MTIDDRHKEEFEKTLLSLLLRSIEIAQEDDLIQITQQFMAHTKHSFYWPYTPLLSLFDKFKAKNGLTEGIKKSLRDIVKRTSKEGHHYAFDKKIYEKATEILNETNNSPIRIAKDPVAKTINQSLLSDQDKWEQIILFLASQKDKSLPTKKWLIEAQVILKEDLTKHFTLWFDTLIEIFKEVHKEKELNKNLPHDSTIAYLRGAIWISGLINDPVLNNKVEELGLWCFKKLSGHGALSVKLGNATIYSFSLLPFKDGIERLTKFRMKIKYSSVLGTIEKTIKKVAEKEGKTMDQLEEMSISSFNLNSNYEAIENVGEYKSVIKISSFNKVQLSWISPSQKDQKTVPKILKEQFPDDIKFLKSKIKDIQTSLSAHKSRIESYYLKKSLELQ